MDIQQLGINTLRMLALDAVQKAGSGHPGLPLGAAPMAWVLWREVLRQDPADPGWPDRDRFVLSAGHGSALLYTALHLAGYGISIRDLEDFRQWGSSTPGHPEYLPAAGIETTTGPLGQGFATGVGMAMAERHLAARFNRPGFPVVDHRTYAIVSDGDLMEGVAAEAASLAGELGLGRLIYLYDSNGITLAGETRLTFTEDVGRRFEAYGWQVLAVEDGNDAGAIRSALAAARDDEARPSLIIVRTHIGYGSPLQDDFNVHGAPLSPEDYARTREFFDWPQGSYFFVPPEVKADFREAAAAGAAARNEWGAMMEGFTREHPGLREEWDTVMAGELPAGWDGDIPAFEADPRGLATRVAGGQVLSAIAGRVPGLMGGSGDLDPSTRTALAGKGVFQRPGSPGVVQGAVSGPWGYEGANISFGVREHAMAAIASGLALHGGIIPYTATFFVFSDYMRPAMRLAALMGLRVTYVFTHDSVGVGEDGPTHQPVEHLAGLRAMPGLTVIRPGDANETAEAWRVAMQHGHGPVALILSRQSLPTLDRSRLAGAGELKRGGYILARESGAIPDIILIGSGSELSLALAVHDRLTGEGVCCRVVSLPSWELFEEQEQAYRDEVLPPGVTTRVSVEAGATLGWERYVGREGLAVGIDRFGASAPGGIVMEKLGLTADRLYEQAKGLL
ncbi:MAG: transketolase [Gaiellales bacterium]|nr:MAG: transketolase [Gaiellales bacterium]